MVDAPDTAAVLAFDYPYRRASKDRDAVLRDRLRLGDSIRDRSRIREFLEIAPPFLFGWLRCLLWLGVELLDWNGLRSRDGVDLGFIEYGQTADAQGRSTLGLRFAFHVRIAQVLAFEICQRHRSSRDIFAARPLCHGDRDGQDVADDLAFHSNDRNAVNRAQLLGATLGCIEHGLAAQSEILKWLREGI